jgi:hypothetical protein
MALHCERGVGRQLVHDLYITALHSYTAESDFTAYHDLRFQ